MDEWRSQGLELDLPSLIEAAQAFGAKPYVLEVDDADLLLAGDMLGRINRQLRRRGLPELSVAPQDAAEMASLIFYSLATRYAEVLRKLAEITGKKFRCLYIFGGGSQNEFLNQLTAKASGLPVLRAGIEGSTFGNFAVQLSALERSGASTHAWAARLVIAHHDVGADIGAMC
jgi:rhamnulokinase